MKNATQNHLVKVNTVQTIGLAKLKKMAKKLKTQFPNEKLSQCQEVIAHLFDFESFNHLTAILQKNQEGLISPKLAQDVQIQQWMETFWSVSEGNLYQTYPEWVELNNRGFNYTYTVLSENAQTWFESEVERDLEVFDKISEYVVCKTKHDTNWMLTNVDKVVELLSKAEIDQSRIAFITQLLGKVNPTKTYIEESTDEADAQFPYYFSVCNEMSDINYTTKEECMLDMYQYLVDYYQLEPNIHCLTTYDAFQHEMNEMIKLLLKLNNH